MGKFIIVCFILLQVNIAAAQQKEPVSSGIITHSNGKMVGFSDLRFIDGKVLYYDISTRKNELVDLADVGLIMDDNQKTIYKGVIKKPEPKAADVTKPLIANDTLYKPDYPEGIYKTKEDFLARKPSYTEHLVPKAIVGTDYYLNTIEDHVYFMKDNDSRLKRVFAVSYKGYLYFRIGAILDNRNKTDRAQSNDFPQSFVRVVSGGNNYFYMEADLTNIWAQGFAYGGVGGTAGHYLAQSMIYKKGIVWDIKNAEFNIFKNCKDYNKFIQPLLPDAVQACKDQQADIIEIRKAIDRVK